MKKLLTISICAGLLMGQGTPVKAADEFVPTTQNFLESDFAQETMNLVSGVVVTAAVLAGIAYLSNKATEYLERSKWKIHKKGTVKETFSSVAGNDNAKEELQDIVNYLKDPSAFHTIGAAIPKGILLEGPPGTGKTLLARALAGEANCTFIAVSGSDFIHMLVGVGANKVNSLFNAARSFGPCIIFIDEIDTLIRQRGGADISGHDEHGQTLNKLLEQMDGFEKNKYPIVVIGATNRIKTADPAALRPGRFDRIVHVDLPTTKDRRAILELHLQKIEHDASIDLSPIAQRTTGFAGANLANIINEAAIIALNKGKKQVSQTDLEEALDKVIMGKSNKNLGLSQEEKRITAYHEAGHALTHVLLHGDKATLHKVSIISRGNTGGHTAFLPQETYTYDKHYFTNRIIEVFGGMAAEKIIYNTVTTGPSQDIQTATEIARSMICHYGMSDTIGPVAYHYNPGSTLPMYAQSTLAALDAEVKTIVEDCYQQALTLLTQHKDKLDTLATALLEKEELSAQEVYALAK